VGLEEGQLGLAPGQVRPCDVGLGEGLARAVERVLGRGRVGREGFLGLVAGEVDGRGSCPFGVRARGGLEVGGGEEGGVGWFREGAEGGVRGEGGGRV